MPIDRGRIVVDTHPDADVRLLPGRAALVAATRTLLLADLHLGKAATFRRHGIPVPEGSAERDLDRLARLVADVGAKRVIVVGDLLHAAAGCTPGVIGQFRAFRDGCPATAFLLVLGNHDVAARKHAEALGLDGCVDAIDEAPLRFVHSAAHAREPLPEGIGLVVAGHVHPRVVLSAAGGDRLAERCFHLDGGVLTLPAFGSFTGGQSMPGSANARAWIARDDGVVEVTRLLRRAERA